MTENELKRFLTEAVVEALDIDKEKLRQCRQRIPRDMGDMQIGFHRKLHLPDFILDKVERSYTRLKGQYTPTRHYFEELQKDEQHKIDIDEVVPLANSIDNIRDCVVDVIATFVPPTRDENGNVVVKKQYLIYSFLVRVPFRDGLHAYIALGGKYPKIITAYVNEKMRSDRKNPNSWMFVKDKRGRKTKESELEAKLNKRRNGVTLGTDQNKAQIEKAVREAVSEALSRKRKRKRTVNDKGETVPEKCDKCGSKVVTCICGEPVYKCSKCGRYFGTVPFPD